MTVQDLTLDTVRAVMPKNSRTMITQGYIDKLNSISKDERVREAVKENFLSYVDVLQTGKFKADDYLCAVTYCTHKLMGCNNQEAYIKTFPDRYARMKAEGMTDKEVSGFVSMYNRGKLVNQIMEQTMVPTWVLNQDLYQKAINVQARLMTTSASERVQCMAAESLLNHLKKPEAAIQPTVNIDMRDTGGIEELKATMAKMAQAQLDMIQQGKDTRSIAEQKLVFQEVEDVQSH